MQAMNETEWTFTGQPYLRWPRWVQHACNLSRVGTQAVPVFRGQVVYLGERLVLTGSGEIEHEMTS